MTNPETWLVRKILAALNSLPETKVIKVGSECEVGTPDLLGCSRGRMVALEVKQPGEKPRPIQSHRLDEWRRAGAIAGVVRSVEEAVTLVSDSPAPSSD